MDRQSVICHKCTGVLLATDSRTYTAQRGRLILTNGYCTCPSTAQAPVEPAAEQQSQAPQPQAPAQPQEAQPRNHPVQGQPQAQPTGQSAMVVA
ncbi:hypothetical protein [Streptosporangium fragile]